MADIGRKHNDIEVAARLADVRAVLAKGRWSKKIAGIIAERHGVTLRMVYENDKSAVLADLREALTPEERVNQHALWHLQVDELFAELMAPGKDRTPEYAMAIKLLAMKGKAIGVEAPRQHQHTGPNGGPMVVQVNREHFAAAILELEAEADAAEAGDVEQEG